MLFCLDGRVILKDTTMNSMTRDSITNKMSFRTIVRLFLSLSQGLSDTPMEPRSRWHLVYSDMAGLKTQTMRIDLFIIRWFSL